MYIHIYIYIYILDSHMAPYFACGVVQSTGQSSVVPAKVRSVSQSSAQAIRMLGSEQRCVCKGKKSMLEQ